MAQKKSSKGSKRKHNAKTYKSGLEETVAKQLETLGITGVYEVRKIDYTIPESKHKYTPDFIIPKSTGYGGFLFIETKGIFSRVDRQKHLLIKEQYPGMDLRFIFSNSKSKIYKGSKTTYGMWAEKNGFLYADKTIPKEWIKPRDGMENI